MSTFSAAAAQTNRMSAHVKLLEPARRARALEHYPADSGAGARESRIEFAIQRVAVALVLNTVVLAALAASLSLRMTDPHWWALLIVLVACIGMSASFASTYRVLAHGQRDRARAQADRVFVKQERQRRADRGLDITATVFNKSSAPIWRVEVKPLRAGAPYEHDGVAQPLPDLWPNEAYSWRWYVPASEASGEDRHPRLRFTDCSDLRWEKVGSTSCLVSRPRRRLSMRRGSLRRA